MSIIVSLTHNKFCKFVSLLLIMSLGTPSSLCPEQETSYRRHSTNEASPNDSTVLRRVASLTLDRVTLDSRNNSKSKLVSQKLDSQFFEKFEGESIHNFNYQFFSLTMNPEIFYFIYFIFNN